MKKSDIVVIGAGIVGVTTALEAQSRGRTVLLVDKCEPGTETSFGNAGVLSDASVVILNNPQIIRRLPGLVFGGGNSVRIDPVYLMKKLPWMIRFLSFASTRHMNKAGRALYALLNFSLERHDELLLKKGPEDLFNQKGWMHLFRSRSVYEARQLETKLWEALNIPMTHIDGQDLPQWEPCLKPVFHAAVNFDNTRSVTSPHDMVAEYRRQFEEKGGLFVQHGVRDIQHASPQKSGFSQWKIDLVDDTSIVTSDVVLAAGPWAPDLARLLGYQIPMSWERGYHMHVGAPSPDALRRPVYDYERGYVASPQKDSVRILTGVELAHRDAPKNLTQINRAVEDARSLADFGEPLDLEPWLGSRPILPDNLPMIGPAPRHRGIWFNFGHQHIGMASSAGCASVLCDLMDGRPPQIDVEAFAPKRFSMI